MYVLANSWTSLHLTLYICEMFLAKQLWGLNEIVYFSLACNKHSSASHDCHFQTTSGEWALRHRAPPTHQPPDWELHSSHNGSHDSSKQVSQQPKATQGHTARRQPSWNMSPGRGDSTRAALGCVANSPEFPSNCLGRGVGNIDPTAVTRAMPQQAHPARLPLCCARQVLPQSGSAQRAEPDAGPPARITVFPRTGGNCPHQPRLTGCLLSKLLL